MCAFREKTDALLGVLVNSGSAWARLGAYRGLVTLRTSRIQLSRDHCTKVALHSGAMCSSRVNHDYHNLHHVT